MGIFNGKCRKWRNKAYETAKEISSSNIKTLKQFYQYGDCNTCQDVTCKKRIKIYKTNNFKTK